MACTHAVKVSCVLLSKLQYLPSAIGCLLLLIFVLLTCHLGAGRAHSDNNSLLAGRSSDRTPVVVKHSAPALGSTHPPIQWVPGPSRVKTAGASPSSPTPSSAEVNEMVDIPLVSLWAFVACYSLNSQAT